MRLLPPAVIIMTALPAHKSIAPFFSRDVFQAAVIVEQ
jgi:hypothetical protein